MVCDDFLSDTQVKAILDKPVKWEKGETKDLSKNDIRVVDLADITTYINLRTMAFDHIKKLNNKLFRYDISKINQINLLRYNPGGKYDWHQDVAYGAKEHRKLTFIIQLSDPDEYEGGTLEFRDGGFNGEAAKKKGSIIIFPSFLYHRITPISKGIRHSIVGWAVGPQWR